MEESGSAGAPEDLYARVYDAARPEIFFKSAGWRCVGDGQPVGIRADSTWDVPEPELTVVVDAGGEIVGYTVGNDVSSRSIEGENALYLPQAKTYHASCALGPWIMLREELADVSNLEISMEIERNGVQVWEGAISTARMHRKLDELVAYVYRALLFPSGALLMTGTGLVPPSDFTLQSGDQVTIEIEGIGKLTNQALRLESR
jgi:2-dehydro-3-deoxy-D-arabinonate dehydratase